jgi:large subunit ribosomal protein L22
MKHNYAFNKEKENTVKVVGRDLGISHKQAIEVCSFIKNKKTSTMISYLEKVVEQKLAIPFKKFTEGAGHKKGVGSGKFPVKTSQAFIMLIKSLEANAQNKGLGSDLKIIHACANKASSPMRGGRKRRVESKRAHVEIAAIEMEEEKNIQKKPTKKKSSIKEESQSKETKQESKPAPAKKAEEKSKSSETKQDKKDSGENKK